MDTTMLYNLVVRENTQMLKNLSTWLNKAAEYAKTKENGDVNALLQQRLVFDQFPLLKQVQATCDCAKFAAARLAGKEPPKHPDTETTFEQLQTRIQSVITYLNTFKTDDFKTAMTQKIQQPWMPGKYLEAMDYLTQLAIPNMFFHTTTAYSIMRAHGVNIGKSEFIGELNFKNL